MKNIILAIAFCVPGLAFATPVNKSCPVGHREARADITVNYKGKDVGLCCNNCKKKFEADPEKYAPNIKEDR